MALSRTPARSWIQSSQHPLDCVLSLPFRGGTNRRGPCTGTGEPDLNPHGTDLTPTFSTGTGPSQTVMRVPLQPPSCCACQVRKHLPSPVPSAPLLLCLLSDEPQCRGGNGVCTPTLSHWELVALVQTDSLPLYTPYGVSWWCGIRICWGFFFWCNTFEYFSQHENTTLVV